MYILKLWGIFDPRQRRNSIIILLLMLIGVAMETIGVSMIIPLIALFTGQESINKYPVISNIFDIFDYPEVEIQIIVLLTFMVILFLIKNTYIAFLIYVQTRFTFNVRKVISDRLFTHYIRQPYTFHLVRNTAQLIQIITEESTVFATAVLMPLLVLVSEFLVAISLTLLIFYMTTWLSMMSVVLLFVGGAVFYAMIKNKLRKWGNLRHYHEGYRIQSIQTGLGAIRDIKILGREEEFLKKFRHHNKIDAKLLRNNTIVNQIPRLWFEVIAIAGLTLVVIVSFYQHKSPDEVITIMGLFAAATFRLAPSATRIMSSLQKLRFSHITVNAIYDELNEKTDISEYENNTNQDILNVEEISINNVSFKYPGATKYSLNNISFKINAGESIGIIGTSGSGKTTLLNLLLGLVRPTSGEILVDEYNIHDNLRNWQDNIGYVPQSIYLSDDTLLNNIAFGINKHDIDLNLVQQAVEMSNLNEFISSLSDGLNTIVGERGTRLSGGQQQRIAIARALYHNPSILIFDEATSALDIDTEKEVMHAINKLHGKKTIIIVAHRLSTVKDCDIIFELHNGKIRAVEKYEQISKDKLGV